jgi:PAS domain S-box-containing protein
MYGEVAKVIYLSNDITNEKLMEMESRKQTDQLKVQEEKLKLSGIELKKRLEQSKKETELQYKQIEKENNQYKEILMDVPVIIVNFDQSGNIILINSAGEKFWSVKTSSVKGRNIKTLLTGTSESYSDPLKSLLQPDNAIPTGKFKNVKLPDGKDEWYRADISISLTELHDEVSYTAYIQLV